MRQIFLTKEFEALPPRHVSKAGVRTNGHPAFCCLNPVCDIMVGGHLAKTLRTSAPSKVRVRAAKPHEPKLESIPTQTG